MRYASAECVAKSTDDGPERRSCAREGLQDCAQSRLRRCGEMSRRPLPYCHTAIAVSAPSNRLHSVGRRPDLGCSRTVDCPHRHRDRHSGLWSGVIRQSLARSATGKTKCVNEAERAEAGRGREMQSIHASELTLAACYSCTSDGKAVQVRGGEGGAPPHQPHKQAKARATCTGESTHSTDTVCSVMANSTAHSFLSCRLSG